MPNTPPHDPNIDYRAHPELYRVAPQPAEKPLHSVEMDELYTFIGQKKTESTSQLLSSVEAVA